jgi:polyvinyl alcohol dehydrogenase (cytochrome)
MNGVLRVTFNWLDRRVAARPLYAATVFVFGIGGAACNSKNKSSPTQVATTPDAAIVANDAAPIVATPSDLDCNAESPDWPMFGQNVCNTSSQQNAAGITPDSVKRLKTKWVYDAAGDVSATPAVVGAAVYIADWGGMVSRLDADTGLPVWSRSVGDLIGSSLSAFVSRTTAVVTADAVIFGTQRNQPDLTASQGPGAYIIALDPNTGALKWKARMDTHPAAVITSSPVVDGNRLYVGVGSLEEVFGPSSPNYSYTFRGSIAALDVSTGTFLWRTYTITDAVYYGEAGAAPDMASDGGDEGGEGGAATAGYAGAAVWSSSPTVDRKRKQLYVTTGNNYAAPADAPPSVDGNWVDSVLALDLNTGAVKWGRSLPAGGAEGGTDVFTLTNLAGPDSDFGCGANLFATTIDGQVRDLVGAGQKSGNYWAFDPDTGKIVWTTKVGPGGALGGFHWGTATDGARIYGEVNNETGTPFAILGSGRQAGQMSTTGLWAALDSATGKVLWEIADPAMSQPLNGAAVDGPTVVVNGVVFAGSMDGMGTMYALNAATGDVLWSFQSGGTVYGGPAVANGVVYWGCGYPSSRLGFGTSCKKLYAFDIGP